MTGPRVTRFAPSPTGLLHIGHGYSAVRAHDLARQHGGDFLVRFEDIDSGRVRDVYYDSILADLRWLGLTWDGQPMRQSRRFPAYRKALDRLKTDGLVYPCFCTRKDIAAEIAASASAPHGPDGPLYPGTCRDLSDSERKRRIAEESHAWRIDIARATAVAGRLSWTDAAQGTIAATPEIHGDVVLARKDVPTSYHLAVVVDDADQRITDVVRGGDLFAATHVHRLLQELLDLPLPRYHHHPLITDLEGNRLAKRDNARSLKALREDGINPATLCAAFRSDAPDLGAFSAAI